MMTDIVQNTFTAGELSPRVHGRTDMDRYAQGVKRARNFRPVLHGGIKSREGSLQNAAAVSDTDNASTLIEFVEGQDSAWMAEFGNLVLRIYNADRTYSGIQLTTPYTSAQLPDLDWAQSDSTLWIFHPDVPTQRLQRFGATWVISAAPFTQIPFAEVGFVSATTLTLSAATVGVGRTVTASAPVFLASDVGRAIISDAGIAVITGYTSTTVVTAEITRAFAAVAVPAGWTMESSPQTTCTPSAKDPVGATITLTLGAAGWRAANVGAIVRINGGLCRITAFTSDTVVNAVILRELAATVAAPALSWSLEPIVWSADYGYPRTGTVFQQRLIAAGNRKFPRTVWGSRIGELLDFERWVDDSDSFAFTIDSDETTPIVYVASAKQLAVFTRSAEYSIRSGVEKPITPTNVRVVPESNHGAAQVRPVQVGDEQMFVQRAGKKVRAFGYRYDFDSFRSPDISAIAQHLVKPGVTGMTYAAEAEQTLWATRTDGKLLSCTIDRDQQPSVIGWALHNTDGFIECARAIPSGDRDQVWLIVRRTIGGVSKRYLESLDDSLDPLHPSVPTPSALEERPEYGCTVDSGKVFDNPAGATAFLVPHLAGKTVAILADGSVMPSVVAGALGEVAITRPGKRVIIGLPFTAYFTALTPNLQTMQGTAQGKQMKSGQISLDILASVGGKLRTNDGPDEALPTRSFGAGVLDQMPLPFTGMKLVTKLGWDRAVAEITVTQDQPLPLHVRQLVRDVSTGG